jgi:hypothetical protein
MTSLNHRLNCPKKAACAGQINGIKVTGISHKPTIFLLLPALLKIRKPTTGIIKRIGIFVNIAKPNEIPDAKIGKDLNLECLRCIAKNIEDKRKGKRMVSNNILLLIHVIGMDANRREAKRATFPL